MRERLALALAAALLACRPGAPGARRPDAQVAPAPVAPPRIAHPEGDARVSTLVQHLLDKNPAVVDEARAAGPAAAGPLFPLLNHADWEVRELALYCLDAAGAPGTATASAARLLDPNSQVRAAALEGLRHRAAPADEEALLRAWDGGPEATIRRELALLVGREAAGPDALAQIAHRCAAETDADALEGCLVARARLGDDGARRDVAQHLAGSPGRARERWLMYGWYLRAPWLLAPLRPVLDDRTELQWVGLDGHPELTQHLRACDLAVNLVAAITGHRFSFEVRGQENPTNYTDDQLAEVGRFLRALP